MACRGHDSQWTSWPQTFLTGCGRRWGVRESAGLGELDCPSGAGVKLPSCDLVAADAIAPYDLRRNSHANYFRGRSAFALARSPASTTRIVTFPSLATDASPA